MRSIVLALLGVVMLAAPAAAVRVRITCTDGKAQAQVKIGARRPVTSPVCDLDGQPDGGCTFQVRRLCIDLCVTGCSCPDYLPPTVLTLRPGARRATKTVKPARRLTFRLRCLRQ